MTIRLKHAGNISEIVRLTIENRPTELHQLLGRKETFDEECQDALFEAEILLGMYEDEDYSRVVGILKNKKFR